MSGGTVVKTMTNQLQIPLPSFFVNGDICYVLCGRKPAPRAIFQAAHIFDAVRLCACMRLEVHVSYLPWACNV